MPNPTPPRGAHRPPTHPGPDTAATAAGDRTIEAELADQPSIVDDVRTPRRSRAALAVLLAAALFGVLGLTYLTNLGSDVEAQRDDSARTLDVLAQATVAACREGVMVPAPQGIDACAKAISATSGPVDPASVAALVRSIIGVTAPALRFDPDVIAAQLGALLPQLGAAAIDAVVDAQVAAAQGSARPADAQAVTEGAITPPPTSDPAPGGAPDPPDPVRPTSDRPVPTTDPDQPATDPDPPVSSEPATGPDPVEPAPPQATGIAFERDGDGACRAVTTYDDGSSVTDDADDASCDPVPGPDPTSDPEPTTAPSPADEVPSGAAPTETDEPLISVN